MFPNALENLVRRLPAGPAAAIQSWWSGLSAPDRDALGCLYRDDRRRRPRVIGRFVSHRAHQRSEAQPNIDFYEYLVNHELSLDDGRRFHICSAHPRARKAILAGLIPAPFVCPLASTDCPMRAALDHRPGCDLQLRRA